MKLAKRTKRLTLKVMGPEDFELWAEFQAELRPNAEVGRAAFKSALKREMDQAKRDLRWEIKIFERESRRMIGFIDIKTVNRDPYQVCDVGYVILESARGNGYASEATAMLIPEIFKKLKFHRLEFAIEPQNKASIRVAKSLGLHKEGLRKHYWPTNYPKPSKEWSDQVIYVATPELFRIS